VAFEPTTPGLKVRDPFAEPASTTCLQSRRPPLGGPRVACVVTSNRRWSGRRGSNPRQPATRIGRTTGTVPLPRKNLRCVLPPQAGPQTVVPQDTSVILRYELAAPGARRPPADRLAANVPPPTSPSMGFHQEGGWSGQRESNPPSLLGREMCHHNTLAAHACSQQAVFIQRWRPDVSGHELLLGRQELYH
jgi:hypothetical protein